MRFVTSMCWVRKGCGKTPTKIKLDKSEMSEIFATDSAANKYETDEEADDQEHESEADSEGENKKIEKKYKMNDYDDEDAQLRLDPLNSLACFSSNAEDHYLEIKDDGEGSDEEDIEIKPSDNLVVCGTIDDDDSSLNIYVYNEDNNQFYMHHDILLSSVPICIEWIDFDPTVENENVNYVAVGTMNPWIEIWDLDLMDSLEPEFILGTTDLKKLKKKKKTGEKPKKKDKIIGHKDSVLSLSYNTLNRNILASGSADKTIVLWDLSELKQVVKIKHHKDKVQSLKFHPIESFSLLSGSCDQTVAMFDCRNPNENKLSWSLQENDCEQVIWNHFKPNNFLCSDDEGYVYIFDIRNNEKAVQTFRAHESAVVGLALSSTCPNLLVTGCEDEIVKIWDIENDTFEFVNEKAFKVGSLNAIKQSPDSSFTFSFGGTKSSEPVVWDIQELKEVRDRFYPRMNLKEPVEEEEVKESNKDEVKTSRRRERALKFKKMQQELHGRGKSKGKGKKKRQYKN